MNYHRKPFQVLLILLALVGAMTIMSLGSAALADLKEIKKKGVIRHLGVIYANFVTGSGDGLDVELVKLFAEKLGVQYEFVETSWTGAIGDLTGKKVVPKGNDDIEIVSEVPIRGDVIATGFTVLPWRQKIVDYSAPSFPTQVWLITRIDFGLNPIEPSGSIEQDIAAVKQKIRGHSVLGVPATCLDPNLYGVREAGASTVNFLMTLNALAPAVINKDAEATLLDVPDALTALQKWPGKIKVIGPLSPVQHMALAFDKGCPALRDEFNRFFDQIKRDGTYNQLAKKYYPIVFDYYPKFFQAK